MTTARGITKHTPAKPEFETLRSAAERKAVSVDTLRRLIDSGVLPAYTVTGRRGAMVRVRITDVDSLMAPYAAPRSTPISAASPRRRNGAAGQK